jgi:hypothetical protein
MANMANTACDTACAWWRYSPTARSKHDAILLHHI